MEFFRHCPGCGRRFHIRLENKKSLSGHMEPGPGRPVRLMGRMGSMVYEGDPIVIDVEDFQYTYKCGHCGHEWSEMHEEERRVG